MKSRNTSSIIYICLISIALININPSHAESSTVDDADSNDFENFHKENNGKKSAIHKLLWGETTSEQPSNDSIQTNQQQSVENSALNTYTASVLYSLAPQLFDINTITYSLHKQMIIQCPSGWKKVSEWSKANNNNEIIQSYQFSCL